MVVNVTCFKGDPILDLVKLETADNITIVYGLYLLVFNRRTVVQNVDLVLQDQLAVHVHLTLADIPYEIKPGTWYMQHS